MTGATATLARFVATTGFADLPAGSVDRLKSYVLDAIGAGMVGQDLPWTAIVREQARRTGGAGQASAFGTSGKLPAPAAAFVNGIAIGGFELDHGAHVAHPASTVLPAALAAAELVDASGRDFLLALALGYEIACRVGAAQTRAAEDERGFHNPGVNGPFGAAAAAGRLLGLDAGAQAAAFGVAGSFAGGLVEYLSDGSMTKRLHLGAAARAGLEAAQLAAAGFTGPPTILEGPRGLLRAFSPAARPAALTEGLGSRWLATTQRIKPYPCHGALQGLVAALQRFRAEHPGAAASADRVHLVARPQDRLLQERFLQPAPRTLVAAQYSTPVAVAVALSRDLADPRQFGVDVLDDPSVARLARAVTWELAADPAADPAVGPAAASAVDPAVDPAAPGIEVTVTSAGREHRVAVAALPEVDVEEKFRRHTRAWLPPAGQDRVVELVSHLDEVPGVGALAGIVRREEAA